MRLSTTYLAATMQNYDKQSKTHIINTLMIFAFIAIAFGPALQNIVLGCLILAGLWTIKRDDLKQLPLPSALRWPLILSAIWVCMHLISTSLNPKNPNNDYLSYFFGFIPMFFLPWVLFHAKYNANAIRIKLENIFPYFMIAWFLVCLSQGIFGWSLMRETGNPANYRANGFYSHPLTLAYCALLCWPISLYFSQQKLSFLRNKSWLYHIATLSNLGILLLTNSRTCLAVAALIGFWYIFISLKGRHRLIALSFTILAAFGIGLTDNPISRKAANTFSKDSPDIFSDYPDDRIAFWVAHSLMIKERPFSGHGFGLDTPYRKPYYEAIDLGNFIRQYPAHNLFIQVTTNVGFFGLIVFLLWLISLWQLGRKYLGNDRDLRQCYFQILACFILSSLTQDSLYDTEVRYTLSLFISLIYLKVKAESSNASNCNSQTNSRLTN